MNFLNKEFIYLSNKGRHIFKTFPFQISKNSGESNCFF